MTPAVMLLIGGAVLGPIEAKPIPMTEAQKNTFMACMNESRRGDACTARAGGQNEPIAELCARAMKEIGATKMLNSEQWRLTRKFTEAEMDAPGSMTQRWKNEDIDNPIVRCIPVPEGYRK